MKDVFLESLIKQEFIDRESFFLSATMKRIEKMISENDWGTSEH